MFNAQINNNQLRVVASTNTDQAKLALKGSGSPFVAFITGDTATVSVTATILAPATPIVFKVYFEASQISEWSYVLSSSKEHTRVVTTGLVINGATTVDSDHSPAIKADVLTIFFKPAKSSHTVTLKNLYVKACLENGWLCIDYD